MAGRIIRRLSDREDKEQDQKLFLVDKDLLIAGISRAVSTLFRRDGELFNFGKTAINEQTLTFRLGIYLQTEFKQLNVDCEYNRHWDGVKRCYRTNALQWMKPDIVVHRRMSETNVFVLEAKKRQWWGNSQVGWKLLKKKLYELTYSGGEYHYQLGACWQIVESVNPSDHRVYWFINGQNVLTTSLKDFEVGLRAKMAERVAVRKRPSLEIERRLRLLKSKLRP